MLTLFSVMCCALCVALTVYNHRKRAKKMGIKYEGAKTGPIKTDKPKNDAKTWTAHKGAILKGASGTNSKS